MIPDTETNTFPRIMTVQNALTLLLFNFFSISIVVMCRA